MEDRHFLLLRCVRRGRWLAPWLKSAGETAPPICVLLSHQIHHCLLAHDAGHACTYEDKPSHSGTATTSRTARHFSTHGSGQSVALLVATTAASALPPGHGQ